MLRSDRGTGYKLNVFKQYKEKFGIEHQVTGGYNSKQNGKAERQNRTIMEKVSTMISPKISVGSGSPYSCIY